MNNLDYFMGKKKTDNKRDELNRKWENDKKELENKRIEQERLKKEKKYKEDQRRVKMNSIENIAHESLGKNTNKKSYKPEIVIPTSKDIKALNKEKAKPYAEYSNYLRKDVNDIIKDQRIKGIKDNDIKQSLIPKEDDSINKRLEYIATKLKKGKEGLLYNIKEGSYEKEVQNMLSKETVREMNGLSNHVSDIEKFLKDNPDIQESGIADNKVERLIQKGTRGLGHQARLYYDTSKDAAKDPESYIWAGTILAASLLAAPVTGGTSLAAIPLASVATSTAITAIAELKPLAALKLGMSYGKLKSMANMEAAGSYREMTEYGVDKRIAKPLSETIGVFNGLLEYMQLDTATSMIPGVDTLVEKGTNAIKKEMIKKVIKTLGAYGKNISEEAIEEMAQAGISELGLELSKYLQDTPDPTIMGGFKTLAKSMTSKDFRDVVLDEGYEALQYMWLTPIISSGGRIAANKSIEGVAGAVQLNEINKAIESKDKFDKQTLERKKNFILNDKHATDEIIKIVNETLDPKAVEFLITEKEILEDIVQREETTNEDKERYTKTLDKVKETVSKIMYEAKEKNPDIEYKATNEVDIENKILSEGFLDNNELYVESLTQYNIDLYKIAKKQNVLDNIKQELKNGTSKSQIIEKIKKSFPKKERSPLSLMSIINSVEMVDEEIKGQKVINSIHNMTEFNINTQNGPEVEQEINTEKKEVTQEPRTEVNKDTNTSVSKEDKNSTMEVTEHKNGISTEQATKQDTSYKKTQELVEKVAPDTKPQKFEPGNTVKFPVNKINVDADKFQFRYDKGNADGAGKSLSGSKWNEQLSGTILLWESEKGDYFLVNGHHRVSLAKANNVESMEANIISHKDYTAEEARALGAMLNIAENHATSIDVAKLIRDTGKTEAEFEEVGISPNSKIAKDGRALSNLNDFIFTQVATKSIPVERAVIIGRELKGNEDGQIQMIRAIDALASSGKTITNDVLTELIANVKGTAQEKFKVMTMFGEQEITKNYSVERAEIVSYVKSQLKSRISLLKNVSKNKNATILKELGNTIAVEDNVKEMTAADQALWILDKTLNFQGTKANELFNRYAIEYAKASSSRKMSIKKKALDELVNLIEDGTILNDTVNQNIKEDQQITSNEADQLELVGQASMLQMKEMPPVDIIVDEKDKGSSSYKATIKIANAIKNNPIFNGLKVVYSGTSGKQTNMTKEELIKHGYGHLEESTEKYIYGFYNNGDRTITLNTEATRDTILEEAIHDIQHRLQEIDPELNQRVIEWEDDIRESALKEGIVIPEGYELLAQALVYTEFGYASTNPFIANLIAVDDDIVDKFKTLLGKDLIKTATGLVRSETTKSDRKLGSDRLLSNAKNITEIVPGISYQIKPMTEKIDSEEFKEWFGDSKVVDENSKPLEVFHGTNVGGFNQFDGTSFFTNEIAVADTYSESVYEFKNIELTKPVDMDDLLEQLSEYELDVAEYPGEYNIVDENMNSFLEVEYETEEEFLNNIAEDIKNIKTPGIYRAYLSMENPFIITKDMFSEDDFLIVDEEMLEEMPEEIRGLMTWDNIGGKTTNDWVDKIKSEGKHDGVIFRDIFDSGAGSVAKYWDSSDVYVVFEPTQIKSVDNIGTFNKSDPNIYYQLKEEGTSGNLYAMHNITEDKLRNILKLGKIPMSDNNINKKTISQIPSSISLLFNKDKIDTDNKNIELSDIQAVIAPNNLSKELEQMLREKGINLIEKYEGESRQKAIDNLLAEKDLTFQLKDTNSKEFKDWFKDSKVVDEEGKPLKVYHGTNARFNEFITANNWGYGGTYFTPDEDVAISFSNNGIVYPVYVSLQNPFIVDAFNRMYDSIAKPIEMGGEGLADTQEIVAFARNNKYDGVIVKNVIEGTRGLTDDIIAFNPTQIKSVDNRGTWDATNPNIYYQMKEMDPAIKERSWGQTVRDANFTSKELSELLTSNKFMYEVKHNEETILAAAKLIDEKGEAYTEARLLSDIEINAVLFAASQILTYKYMETNQLDRAMNMLDKTAEKATSAGQAIQILSVWGRQTPDGMLRYVFNTFNKLMTETQKQELIDKSKLLTKEFNRINREAISNINFVDSVNKLKNINVDEMLTREMLKTEKGKALIDKYGIETIVKALEDDSGTLEGQAGLEGTIENDQTIINPSDMEELRSMISDNTNIDDEMTDRILTVIDNFLEDEKGNLKDRLANIGLNEFESKLLSSYVKQQINEATKDSKQSIIDSNLSKNKHERKGLDEKIIELSMDLTLDGRKNDAALKALIAEKEGMPVLDDEFIQYIYEQGKHINSLEIGTRERDVETGKLLAEIANRIPSSMWSKVNVIQTMAQLLNFKTIIRNLLGNEMFAKMDTVIHNYIAAPLDAIISLKTKQRTAVHRNILKLFKTQYKGYGQGLKIGIEDALMGIDTSDDMSKFELKKNATFNSGPLAVMEKTLNIALRATDRAAFTAAYVDSIEEQKTISGVDTPTEEMIENATALGLYRTFNDKTLLSQAFKGAKSSLNKASEYLTGVEEFGLGDLVLKYPSTPANILARGIDYSPVGAILAMVALYKNTSNSTYIKQKIAVDGISRALGGSLIIGTGVLLAKLGVLSGGDSDDDKDIYKLLKQYGLRNYVVNISALKRYFATGFSDPKVGELRQGDKLSSYDWAEPLGMSWALGADLILGKGESMNVLDAIASAVVTGATAITEQPLLTGLSRLFGYGDMVSGVEGAVLDAPSSFAPSLLSHIASFIDGRNTDPYTLYSKGRQAYNKVINKVPGMREQLPSRYSILGDELRYYPENIGMVDRFVKSFISPSITANYEPTEEVRLVLDLYKSTGRTDHIPRGPQKQYTFDKVSYSLEPKEFEELSKWMGQEVNKRISYAMNNYMGDWSDEDQADEIEFIIKELGKETREKVEKMKVK